MTRSILDNFFQLTIAVYIRLSANFLFSLEAIGALEDCHLICAGVRSCLIKWRVLPFSAAADATCTRTSSVSMCDAFSPDLPLNLYQPPRLPEPDWKLHLLMQHFFSSASSSLYTSSLGWDTWSLSRELAGFSSSVATWGDSALRSVCSPHAAMLLPHDMLKVYICTATGSGRRNHGNMGDGRVNFRFHVRLDSMYHVHVCDLINKTNNECEV